MITIRIDEKDPTLLAVSFAEDPVANNLIREVPGRRWSYSRRCWLLPNTRDSLVKIGQLLGKRIAVSMRLLCGFINLAPAVKWSN